MKQHGLILARISDSVLHSRSGRFRIPAQGGVLPPRVLVGFLLTIVMLCAMTPRAEAWDGKRQGFVLGFGGGGGYLTGSGGGEVAFGSELHLGYSFSGFQIQYLGTTVVGSKVLLTPGVGIEYHPLPSPPGWFFGTGLGITDQFSIEYADGPWGPVYELSVGYQWAEHLAAYALLTHFTKTESVPEEINNTCFQLMIRLEAY